MLLRSGTIASTMAEGNNTITQPAPQVTLLSDPVTIPPFSGSGSESIHAFIRRVEEECTRRAVHTDPEKLAILKSRICQDPSSLAGKLVKTDKFLSFTTFSAFTTALTSHFAGHSKLGATHSLLKVAQTLTHITRSTSDVYKAENIASSLSNELTLQLKSSSWVDSNNKIDADDFKRLLSYFLFVTQLDTSTFAVASDIEFKKDDYLYDVCKKISEKAPPPALPVSAAQASPVNSSGSSQRHHGHSPSRSRSQPRAPRFQHSRPRSKSRNRDVTCHRCGLRGHVLQFCHVALNDQGKPQFDPEAYCTFHNRPGHKLTECRAYQATQKHQVSNQQTPQSGNGQLPTQVPQT